jgi:hypothetical protein
MQIIPYLLNGFLLFIPIFLFNVVLFSRLPEFYQPARWDRIPKPLDLAENIFRFTVFFLPMLLKLDVSSSTASRGWLLYGIGLLIYFASWLVQIFFGQKPFARRWLFRAAPAYTTILWLGGIALLCPVSFIPWVDVRLVYLVCVAIFVFIHTTHAALVYRAEK